MTEHVIVWCPDCECHHLHDEPCSSRPNVDEHAGAEILLEAHQLITGDRHATYAHPADDYAKVVQIFAGLTGVQLSVEQALLFMVAVKMARLRTNLERGGWHHDSIVDAAGYLGCLAMVHEHNY